MESSRFELVELSVSSGDAYQMNAYASRYRCNRLALVYPASVECPSGKVTTFVLMTEERPMFEIVAVYVRELAYGSGILGEIQDLIPHDPHRKPGESPALIHEAK